MDGHDDDAERENEIEFLDLEPGKPDNAVLRGVLDAQQRWTPRRRRPLVALTVVGGMVLLALLWPALTQSKPWLSVLPTPITSPVGIPFRTTVLPFNDLLYIYNDNGQGGGNLEAVNAHTGTPLWHYQGNDVTRVELVDDQLYVTSHSGLSVFNASNRQRLWQQTALLDGWVVNNGVLCVGTARGIEAINAKNGALLWHIDNPGASCQIDNGIVYTSAKQDTDLEALDARDGSLLWHSNKFTPHSDKFTSLRNVYKGILYFSDPDMSWLQAVDGRSGTVLWQQNFPRSYNLLTQGDVVLLYWKTEERVQAFRSRNGALLWQHASAFFPTLLDDGKFIVAPSEGMLTDVLRVDDGSLAWRCTFPGYILALTDGVGYVSMLSSTDGHSGYYAFRTSDGAVLWRLEQPLQTVMVHNGQLGMVSPVDKTLTLLRARDGTTLWRHKLVVPGS